MRISIGAAAALPVCLLLRAACAQDAGPLAPITPNTPMTMDALLGSVNGKPVFVEDVLRPIDGELRNMAANLQKKNRTLSDFRQDARELISRQVQGLIDDILLANAANESLSEDDRQRIEPIMNRIRKEILTQNGGSEALADHALRLRGSSLEKELDDKRRAIVRQLFLNKTLIPKVQVTRQQIMAEYNLHLADQFTKPTEIELFTITVPVAKFLPQMDDPDPAHPGRKIPRLDASAAEVAEALNMATERARELLKQLKAGADFATLAADNSADPHGIKDGGRWPTLKRGDLKWQTLEDAAFALKANTYGDLVVINRDDPMQAGVVILKTGDVTPGHVIPFGEVQEALDRKLRDAQFNVLTSDYIRGLREKGAMETTVERMIDTATQAAISRYVSQ